MKKYIIILLLFIFLLCGCSKEDKQKDIYLESISELKDINSSSKNYPFNLELVLDKITKKEVRYQIILDNVTKDLDDISILAIHDKKTGDVYPSIGIFDETESLKVGEKPSGLILVGYIDFKGDIEDFKSTFKVLVKYKINNKEHKVYYVTKK